MGVVVGTVIDQCLPRQKGHQVDHVRQAGNQYRRSHPEAHQVAADSRRQQPLSHAIGSTTTGEP